MQSTRLCALSGKNLDIVGRIELFGNDNQFQETSSWDGGLKKNPAYLELEDCFLKKCFFRLDGYVVDIQWFLDDKKSEDISAIQAKTKEPHPDPANHQ